MAQKKNGSAQINETSLKHFEGASGRTSPNKPPKRSPSPSKSSTSGKAKGKASARNSDNEEEDGEESGDEAEKLNDEQMGELDTIYRKCVNFHRQDMI